MTCSASESIINGLRGVNVQVIQIGSTTCGKPYGFYPEDNCGTTYFSIQFKGVNAAGFGELRRRLFAEQHLSGRRRALCRVAPCATTSVARSAIRPRTLRRRARISRQSGTNVPRVVGLEAVVHEAVQWRAERRADGSVRKSPWLMNRILEAL